tara:strand:- start:75 stop:272 length:198 start_codon:yes stop_codon:yes gene_type:complete
MRLTKKEKEYLWEALEINITDVDSNLDFLKANADLYNNEGCYSKKAIANETEKLKCLNNILDKLI